MLLFGLALGTDAVQFEAVAGNLDSRQLALKKGVVDRHHLDLLDPSTLVTDEMVVMVGITAVFNLHLIVVLAQFDDAQILKLLKIAVDGVVTQSRIDLAQILVDLGNINVALRIPAYRRNHHLPLLGPAHVIFF